MHTRSTRQIDERDRFVSRLNLGGCVEARTYRGALLFWRIVNGRQLAAMHARHERAMTPAARREARKARERSRELARRDALGEEAIVFAAAQRDACDTFRLGERPERPWHVDEEFYSRHHALTGLYWRVWRETWRALVGCTHRSEAA